MRPFRFYTGVFLVSFSILMLEIIQTRSLGRRLVSPGVSGYQLGDVWFNRNGAVWVYLGALDSPKKPCFTI